MATSLKPTTFILQNHGLGKRANGGEVLATKTDANLQKATYSASRSFTKEVVTYICDQVTAEEDSKTLASLAQVSKAFRDPALDALWRRILGVTPLLRLLPPDLWEVQRQPMLHTRRCIYVLVCFPLPTWFRTT